MGMVQQFTRVCGSFGQNSVVRLGGCLLKYTATGADPGILRGGGGGGGGVCTRAGYDPV